MGETPVNWLLQCPGGSDLREISSCTWQVVLEMEVGEHYGRANREQSSCPILTEQLQQHRELGWDLTHSRVFSGELRL